MPPKLLECMGFNKNNNVDDKLNLPKVFTFFEAVLWLRYRVWPTNEKIDRYTYIYPRNLMPLIDSDNKDRKFRVPLEVKSELKQVGQIDTVDFSYPELNKTLRYAEAMLILDLCELRLVARGELSDTIMLAELKNGVQKIQDSVMDIPQEAWIEDNWFGTGVDWNGCTLETNTSVYTKINIDADCLTTLYPEKGSLVDELWDDAYVSAMCRVAEIALESAEDRKLQRKIEGLQNENGSNLESLPKVGTTLNAIILEVYKSIKIEKRCEKVAAREVFIKLKALKDNYLDVIQGIEKDSGIIWKTDRDAKFKTMPYKTFQNIISGFNNPKN